MRSQDFGGERRQYTSPTTGRLRRRLTLAGVILTCALLIGAIAYFVLLEPPPPPEPPPYAPRPLEANAVIGVPEPDEHMNYTITEPEVGQFRFATVGTIYRQHDGSIKLYLTNFDDNEVYLLCQIVDSSSGELLYESGRLRPGEYVESLFPLVEIENKATPISINVYAQTFGDYQSAGSVSLSNILQPNHT